MHTWTDWSFPKPMLFTNVSEIECSFCCDSKTTTSRWSEIT